MPEFKIVILCNNYIEFIYIYRNILSELKRLEYSIVRDDTNLYSVNLEGMFSGSILYSGGILRPFKNCIISSANDLT